MAGAILLSWCLGQGSWAGMGMRAILLLAIVAIQAGIGHAVLAQTAPATGPSNSEFLPLFEKNSCRSIRDPVDQLFCGDAELNATAAKLNSATQDRLDRLPDRRMAIEENVEWIRNRNASCGVFRRSSISAADFAPIKHCLLRETEGRIAVLTDPNFDCLAENTTAGLLICADPDLAVADKELNTQVLALIAKLNESETEAAFAEYARWTRERDRKCDLDDKDNVPLDELSSSEGCLAEHIRQKTDEIAAAKGDPKLIFGQHLTSASPNADAIDMCVTQIHASNSCQGFIRVSHVDEIDSQVSEQDALVTAQVDMIVLSPFAVCSQVASSCTGTCWDLKSGKAAPAPGSRESFTVAHRLTIEKTFAFQKTAQGSWRCNSPTLPPVDLGLAMNGP